MEDKENNKNSNFWLGLFIGAITAGALVYLLDKEDKNNLVKNLKNDWESIVEKIKKLVNEKDSHLKEALIADELIPEVAAPENLVTNPKQKIKKFFKKSGRILH